MDPKPNHPLDYRPPERRFRVLRRLALAMLVVAVIVGTWLGMSRLREHRKQQAIAVIEQNGGRVFRNNEGVVERVYLTSPAVGDVQLALIAPHLPYLRGMKELDIVGRQITDEGLRSLKNLDPVKELYIFDTNASVAAIDAVKRRFPHVTVKEVAPSLPASKLAALNVYPHAVTALAFLPDGDLLTGSGDGNLRLWPANGTSPTHEIRAHDEWLFSIAVSPDGKIIATGGGDNVIRLWDAAALRKTGELAGHTDDVHAVVFHPDGKSLFSAGDDRTIRVWDVKGERQTQVIDAHEAAIPSLAISPDGTLLASASRDGRARVWRTDTLEAVHVLRHEDDVAAVRFSPDGGTVATGSYDKTIKLWTVSEGKHIRTIHGHTDWIFNIAFSPDGESILSAGRDKSVRVWNTRSGSMTGTLADDRIVSMILFDSDGTFASAAADGSVVVRDWRTWAVRRTLLPVLGEVAYDR